MAPARQDNSLVPFGPKLFGSIRPDDLRWRASNQMKIPNADFLEWTGSEHLSAWLCGCRREARTLCTGNQNQLASTTIVVHW
jgi:hypothetical protein